MMMLSMEFGVWGSGRTVHGSGCGVYKHREREVDRGPLLESVARRPCIGVCGPGLRP